MLVLLCGEVQYDTGEKHYVQKVKIEVKTNKQQTHTHTHTHSRYCILLVSLRRPHVRQRRIQERYQCASVLQVRKGAGRGDRDGEIIVEPQGPQFRQTSSDGGTSRPHDSLRQC